jgi:aspartate/methionine/tyrosine aminotransferase
MAPPIVRFKAALVAELGDRPLIDLSQAMPSYPPPGPVREALSVAADRPEVARYTTDPGLPVVRERVARDLAEGHDARVDAGELILTPGGNAAFHFVANALLDVGEVAHLVSPYYFNHAMSVSLLGGEVREARLPVDRPLAEAIEAGGLDRVRSGEALVVVNPANPTGRAYDRADMSHLLEWAAARDVRLVVDETYLEFFPDHIPPVSVLSLPDWRRNAVVVGTFSKSLAVSGYRLGYVAGAAEVIAEVLKVQDTAAVCAPHPAQVAVRAGLDWPGLAGWRSANRGAINARVGTFVRALGASPGPFRVVSAGAFFAWVEVDRARLAGLGPTEIDPAWRLARAIAHDREVVALPGSVFGRGLDGSLRVAVGNAPEDELVEGAARLQSWGRG